MVLPPSVVVVCCITGAAGAVLVAYAIARFFLPNTLQMNNPFREKPPEQQQYMREVRLRNLGWFEREGWLGQKEVKGDYYVNGGGYGGGYGGGGHVIGGGTREKGKGVQVLEKESESDEV